MSKTDCTGNKAYQIDVHDPWPEHVFFTDKSPVDALLESCFVNGGEIPSKREQSLSKSKTFTNKRRRSQTLSKFPMQNSSRNEIRDLVLQPCSFENPKQRSQIPHTNHTIRNSLRPSLVSSRSTGFSLKDGIEADRSLMIVKRLQEKYPGSLKGPYKAKTELHKEVTLDRILLKLSNDMKTTLELLNTTEHTKGV